METACFQRVAGFGVALRGAPLNNPKRLRVYSGTMRDHLVGEGNLFQPDVMLPSQYRTRQRGRGPQEAEYNLVVAILEDAIHCFKKYRFAEAASAREQYEEAREWFDSTDRAWPFSYENVCMILGIEPDYLRQGLRKWEQRQENATFKPPRVADLPLPDFADVDDVVASAAAV